MKFVDAPLLAEWFRIRQTGASPAEFLTRYRGQKGDFRVPVFSPMKPSGVGEIPARQVSALFDLATSDCRVAAAEERQAEMLLDSEDETFFEDSDWGYEYEEGLGWVQTSRHVIYDDICDFRLPSDPSALRRDACFRAELGFEVSRSNPSLARTLGRLWLTLGACVEFSPSRTRASHCRLILCERKQPAPTVEIADDSCSGFALFETDAFVWVVSDWVMLRPAGGVDASRKWAVWDEIGRVMKLSVKKGAECAPPPRHTAAPLSSAGRLSRKWNAAEDAELLRLYRAGASTDAIGHVHGRSANEVASRLRKLGESHSAETGALWLAFLPAERSALRVAGSGTSTFARISTGLGLQDRAAKAYPASEALRGLPLAGLQDCVPLFSSLEHPGAMLASEQGWLFAKVSLSASWRGVTEVVGFGGADDPFRIVADPFAVRRDSISGASGSNASRTVFLVPDHVPAAFVKLIPGG